MYIELISHNNKLIFWLRPQIFWYKCFYRTFYQQLGQKYFHNVLQIWSIQTWVFWTKKYSFVYWHYLPAQQTFTSQKFSSRPDKNTEQTYQILKWSQSTRPSWTQMHSHDMLSNATNLNNWKQFLLTIYL